MVKLVINIVNIIRASYIALHSFLGIPIVSIDDETCDLVNFSMYLSFFLFIWYPLHKTRSSLSNSSFTNNIFFIASPSTNSSRWILQKTLRPSALLPRRSSARILSPSRTVALDPYLPPPIMVRYADAVVTRPYAMIREWPRSCSEWLTKSSSEYETRYCQDLYSPSYIPPRPQSLQRHPSRASRTTLVRNFDFI
ncbi:hypothetical protein F4781DRAFT_63832 [Annulohypoxylon bovei var. microspora]|nr:hypothetical protein F4781DRAFT_63832 [Annulohypoxylon bovei var. microspora]